ncbi:MAG: Calx-beta domain-containing protein [Crocinitomicaceae bacterium]
MRNYLSSIALMLIYFTFSGLLMGQKGPGGVSTEVAGPDSDCKLWLDAGSIVAPDGALLSIWQDESLSQDDNSPTQTDPAFQPTYRSDLSASINGEPIVRFFPNKFLQFITKDDINNSGPYTERTTILAFRTGTDVTTRQILYEQGGNVRGLNIYILNGELYMGGYDLNVDGDGTPSWGYTFTTVPVQPNTVYVVSHIFEGPLGATTGTITGYLNGQIFSSYAGGTAPASGVGSLWTHPNAPGLGSCNGQTVVEGNTIISNTGGFPFLGDMAEFIAYNKIVNDAERIILENYLGAKYFANLIVNDYYDYQDTYGKEVIGIGRDVGASNLHNTSQARNCFEIEGNSASFADVDQEFLLIGHNNADDQTWSVTGVSTRVNTQRILRTWRADHSGDLGDITVSLDSTLVPNLPAGYIYVCLVDETGGVTPNFSTAKAYELDNGGAGNIFSNTFPIPHGSYISIGIVKPTAYFTYSTTSAFENNGPVQNVNVPLELNFIPISDKIIDYISTSISANNPSDYTVPGVSTTISAGTNTANIATTVEFDLIPESTENYRLTISTTATVQGIAIGVTNNINLFTIFDDDNTPKIAFNAATSTTPENAGAITIQINRSGNTTPAVSCQYRLRIVGGSGTATSGADYTFVTGTATFASGVTTYNMPITILDDLLDEPNETVIFELFNVSAGADIEPTGVEHELTIIDDDSPPIVQFRVSASQGPETVGGPLIEVYINAPSSQDITVDYTDLLTGSATLGSDYTVPVTGTLTILAGDTVVYLPLFVVNDAANEPDETINFQLSNPTNATLLGNTTHTYTIKDYTSFEWTGCAGVGTSSDNIIWLNPNDLGTANGGLVTFFTDVSPNGNDAISPAGVQDGIMNQAYSNNRNMLNLDGTDDEYEIFDDALINTSNFNSKHTLVVFETGTINAASTNKEIIYEQGGGTNGINIYIYQGNLYFNIWSISQGWGPISVNTAANLSSNSLYIAVLEYTNDGSNAYITGYLNGATVGTSSVASATPILNSHGDEGAIGGLTGSTRFHDGSTNNSVNFSGRVGDFIHFSDAPFNNTRRIILENHMSSKYNIALSSNQKYPIAWAGTYSYEVAGIGQFSSQDNHSDAQGRAIVRINNANDLDDNDFLLWGHDNASFSISPTPGTADVPGGIDNRLHRVWRIAEPGGNIGTVQISFDLSGLAGGPFNVNDLYLLVDSDDGNFSNSSVISTGRTMAGQTVTFSGIDFNNGQWFTLGTSSAINPLPIELLYFDAKLVNGQVKTSWETASEINNDYFKIEKTTDGQTFELVGIIDGAGNSSAPLYYELVDPNPITGISYYRLTQVDFDGTSTKSDLKSVVYQPKEIRISVFPNPIGEGNLTIELDGVQNTDFKIEVFDMTGRLILSNRKELFNGQNALTLDYLEKGAYLLRIQNQGEEFTFSLIK